MAPVLGYWNIRGLATPIRLLLSQAGVEFEDKLYSEKDTWLAEKFTLGLDFPNLPYYFDGDLKITQSHVILRHLANKHNLAGKNEEERVRADLLAAQVFDYTMDYGRTIAYNPKHEENKEEYAKNLNDRLKLLAGFLGERKFVLGDSLSYADFVLYEYLEVQSFYLPEVVKSYPSLVEFVKRVNELPAVAKYFGSPKAIKFPFNGAPAYVGGPFSDELNKK